MNNYHYQKFRVDDELSTKVFNNMIESIDGGHSYFTKSDVDEFEKYRYLIDDALLSGDLDIPFEIFNKYRKVYKKRFDYVMNFLDQPLDFTSNEMYSVDDEEKDWAYTEEELDREWDKIITSQALSLKLSGSSDSAIVSTLKRRLIGMSLEWQNGIRKISSRLI